ncbi:MAG: hypothetical protein JWP95_1554 [Actinotalea sp.]|nr:hypothetical protein [Actinotalea sp.]
MRERTEERLSGEVGAQVPGLAAEPDVAIAGFPFLTQVAGGELDEVTISTSSVEIDGILLEDVDVLLSGVSTDEPYTAQDVTMTASVSLATMRQMLAIDADLSIEDRELVAESSILGLPLQLNLVPRPAGRAIEIDLVSLSLAGATVSADDLPNALADQVEGLEIPMDGLPAGMELTGLTLTADGVDLTAEGQDIELDMAALGG